MKKLSTGHPSTLASYLDLSRAVFGNDSGAIRYLETKIAESPRGGLEEVVADEGQMIYLLGQKHLECAK